MIDLVVGQKVVIISGHSKGLRGTRLINTIGTVATIFRNDCLVTTVDGEWFYALTDLKPLSELGKIIYGD